MSAVDPNAILADWLKRFDLIENDVQEILLRRHVFRRLQEIVAVNPRLHRQSKLPVRLPHLDRRHVQRDIDALRGAADGLERYATQRIAHLDKEEPTYIPKFEELDRALDVFERLVKHYRLLLRGDAGDVLPVIIYPWEAGLEEPWIPPRRASARRLRGSDGRA